MCTTREIQSRIPKVTVPSAVVVPAGISLPPPLECALGS